MNEYPNTMNVNFIAELQNNSILRFVLCRCVPAWEAQYVKFLQKIPFYVLRKLFSIPRCASYQLTITQEQKQTLISAPHQ
jgi:hypothetical protein